MRFELRSFDTRVALRVALLFLACAAVPVATFAAIGYFQVRGQLARQSWARLEATGKAVSMSLMERLLLLDADLDRLVPGSGAPGFDPEPAAGSGRFVALGATGLDRPDPAGLPLGPETAARIAAHRTALFVTDDLAPRIFLVRSPDAGGVVKWGEVSRSYLELVANNLPADARLCVSVEGRRLLGCGHLQELEASPIRGEHDSRRSVEWNGPDGTWLGVSRELFLTAEFGAAPWRVLVSERRDRVFAPLASFNRTFLLVCILCTLIVGFASREQLHRTLDPLSRLIHGTQRVAAGDLGVRVDLHTGDEFEELSESFNQMVSTLARQFRALSTSHEIDGAILGAQEIPTIAETVLRQLPGLLGVDRTAIILFDPDPGCEFELGEGDELLERAPHLGRSALAARLADGGQGRPGSTFDAYVPIRLAGELKGVVGLARSGSPLDERELGHVRQIADHVAVAIQNAVLLRDLGDLHVGTLRALAGAIDAKSRWTAGHSNRVTKVALQIGGEMGLGPTELEILERGSILHDVGKIAVPARILDKEGRLTAEEWEIMRSHPWHGVRIVQPITQYAPLLPIIAQHHERWDGSGYPGGLAGEEIDPLARIAAVADVFDALTSDRPYRAGLSVDEVVDMIVASRGEAFDPHVIDAFVRTETGRRRDTGPSRGRRAGGARLPERVA